MGEGDMALGLGRCVFPTLLTLERCTSVNSLQIIAFSSLSRGFLPSFIYLRFQLTSRLEMDAFSMLSTLVAECWLLATWLSGVVCNSHT